MFIETLLKRLFMKNIIYEKFGNEIMSVINFDIFIGKVESLQGDYVKIPVILTTYKTIQTISKPTYYTGGCHG